VVFDVSKEHNYFSPKILTTALLFNPEDGSSVFLQKLKNRL
jgi:hypothetical protein